MSDDGQSKKPSSFVTSAEKNLIDELIAVSERLNASGDGANGEKLRQERLAVLAKFEEQAETVHSAFSTLGVDMQAVRAFLGKCPYRLDQLLVSQEPWPFDDLSQLDSRFGALPPGYCYCYLAPETSTVPAAVANVANNIIRLPSAVNLVLGEEMQRAGDEFPECRLWDSLYSQPAEMIRLWTLRLLAHRRIVEKSELPAVSGEKSNVPSAGMLEDVPVQDVGADPRIKSFIERFVELTLFQYEGEEQESDVTAFHCALDKRELVKRFSETVPGGCRALQSILGYPDVAVRVAAATYLLGWSPQAAVPVLREVAATWPVDDEEQRAAIACFHAQCALWLHEDGVPPFVG